jgi:hypothetical protein
VQAIAQSELRPEDAIIMVVGDPALFGGIEALEVFGEVTVIDLDNLDNTDGAAVPYQEVPYQGVPYPAVTRAARQP